MGNEPAGRVGNQPSQPMHPSARPPCDQLQSPHQWHLEGTGYSLGAWEREGSGIRRGLCRSGDPSPFSFRSDFLCDLAKPLDLSGHNLLPLTFLSHQESHSEDEWQQKYCPIIVPKTALQ